MSLVLVDDHLLLRFLLGEEPPTLRSSEARIATTGLWYHRLCRALADRRVIGSMSRRLGGVEDELAEAVVASVIDLPETVELVSLRTLAWPMAEVVRAGIRLNLLSLEALAAARHLAAEICLAPEDDNVPLRAAALDVGIPLRVVGT